MNHQEQFPPCRKVLIIDDTYIDRYVAERNIIKSGFADEVVTKESAKSALNYLMEFKDNPDQLPQLIFLDIRMPEIDGFGFLKEYEKLPDSIKSSCIIMMLSTSLNPDDHEMAKKNIYVNDFLNKPLNTEKLNLISKQLRGKFIEKKIN